MSNIDQQQYDENDNEHGEWIEYYDNGQLKDRHNYFHGFLHGLWESYQSDGELFYRGNFNMNRKIGYWNYSDKRKNYYLWLI